MEPGNGTTTTASSWWLVVGGRWSPLRLPCLSVAAALAVAVSFLWIVVMSILVKKAGLEFYAKVSTTLAHPSHRRERALTADPFLSVECVLSVYENAYIRKRMKNKNLALSKRTNS
jgi:hypothetical protein